MYCVNWFCNRWLSALDFKILGRAFRARFLKKGDKTYTILSKLTVSFPLKIHSNLEFSATLKRSDNEQICAKDTGGGERDFHVRNHFEKFEKGTK